MQEFSTGCHKLSSFARGVQTNCDIFAYGEALATTRRGLSLPGYYNDISFDNFDDLCKFPMTPLNINYL